MFIYTPLYPLCLLPTLFQCQYTLSVMQQPNQLQRSNYVFMKGLRKAKICLPAGVPVSSICCQPPRCFINTQCISSLTTSINNFKKLLSALFFCFSSTYFLSTFLQFALEFPLVSSHYFRFLAQILLHVHFLTNFLLFNSIFALFAVCVSLNFLYLSSFYSPFYFTFVPRFIDSLLTALALFHSSVHLSSAWLFTSLFQLVLPFAAPFMLASYLYMEILTEQNGNISGKTRREDIHTLSFPANDVKIINCSRNS